MSARGGKIDWLVAWAIGSLAALALLSVGLRPHREQALSVFCAASMRPPLERIAAAYQAERGVAVYLQYGGSQTLLSQIETASGADVYLPADESYADMAVRMGLAKAPTPVAEMHGVIVVAPGNPRKIHSWRDLLRDDVRTALGNPDQAAIGAAVRAALAAEGNWKALDEAIQLRGVYKPTVADAANDVTLDAADASIVWDAVAFQYPQLEVVSDASLAKLVVGRVSGVTLNDAHRTDEARQFVEYLASPEGGQRVFQEFGFRPIAHSVK